MELLRLWNSYIVLPHEAETVKVTFFVTLLLFILFNVLCRFAFPVCDSTHSDCQGETLLPAATHMQLHIQLSKREPVFVTRASVSLSLSLAVLKRLVVRVANHIRITSGTLCFHS